MTTSQRLKIKSSQQSVVTETVQPAPYMPSQQAQPQYKKVSFRGGVARWELD